MGTSASVVGADDWPEELLDCKYFRIIQNTSSNLQFLVVTLPEPSILINMRIDDTDEPQLAITPVLSHFVGQLPIWFCVLT